MHGLDRHSVFIDRLEIDGLAGRNGETNTSVFFNRNLTKDAAGKAFAADPYVRLIDGNGRFGIDLDDAQSLYLCIFWKLSEVVY